MRRTTTIFYPAPPWTEADVDRELKLQMRISVSCEKAVSDDPAGWKLTVVRNYPDD